MADPKETNNSASPKISIPSIKELFEAGVQFGHETRRWDPKMERFIYDSKKNIHIIDIAQTRAQLEEAVKFLYKASSEGEIIFVGTKKQAAEIVKTNAINSGAHFIDKRWAGGLLTNFTKVKESFLRLRDLETMFEKGVEGRTKYEISLLKKEWQKLNRLYSGIKTLSQKPKAVVIVDIRYEKGALREAKKMGIPVVGIVDTNADPSLVQYPIPANDDAISSIKVIVNTLADAVQKGNNGKGVHHLLKDYTSVEVEIIRKEDDSEDTPIQAPQNFSEVTSVTNVGGSQNTKRVIKKVVKNTPKKKENTSQKGILERVQEQKKK